MCSPPPSVYHRMVAFDDPNTAAILDGRNLSPWIDESPKAGYKYAKTGYRNHDVSPATSVGSRSSVGSVGSRSTATSSSSSSSSGSSSSGSSNGRWQ